MNSPPGLTRVMGPSAAQAPLPSTTNMNLARCPTVTSLAGARKRTPPAAMSLSSTVSGVVAAGEVDLDRQTDRERADAAGGWRVRDHAWLSLAL